MLCYVMLNSTVLKCSAALKFSFECVHAYSRSPSARHPPKAGACCRIKILMDVIITNLWLTVHRNSVWIRNQLDVTFMLSFISPLHVEQLVKKK